MHWVAFLAACIALILARLLRAPGRSSLLAGLGAFLFAFAVTTFTVRMVSERADLVRPSDYNAFIAHAVKQVENDPDAPIVLFLGASYSRNAIDEEALTKALRARGYPHRVINLSLEGASLQERDAHLRAFLRLSPRAPDVTFIEAAHEFDADPTYVFRVAKFSDRAIGQFDPRSTFWAMKGLSQGACDGLSGCGKSWALLGIHSGMNFTNLGLLATGEGRESISAKPSFDPQHAPREEFTETLKDIRAQLSEGKEIVPAEGPSWARLLRAEQRDYLMDEGVRRIAYYYPPVLPPDERAYFAGLCAGELSDHPCIAPIDPKLLNPLQGEVWLDEKHLLQDGAEIYTEWLAGQIDRWGALK